MPDTPTRKKPTTLRTAMRRLNEAERTIEHQNELIRKYEEVRGTNSTEAVEVGAGVGRRGRELLPVADEADQFEPAYPGPGWKITSGPTAFPVDVVHNGIVDPTSLSATVELLHRSINALESAVSRVQQAVEPVRVPVDQEAPETDETDAKLSPLTQAVYAAQRRVRGLASMLSHLAAEIRV